MNVPNKITVFRFCCVPFLFAASLIQFRYHWVVALLIYFVACMSDKADGIIARKEGLVTDFGKLNDEIFYFIEFDPTVIRFFKLQDDKLMEIDDVELSDYNFEVKYQDDISPRYMQNSDYAVMNFDNWNESKTLVFGYENGKIVDCSSKIKGDAFATFFWNDNWYLLTLEEKETGIFRLYDANLNELSSVENKKVLESGQYCVNAGFDGNGNVTVNYEWSK